VAAEAAVAAARALPTPANWMKKMRRVVEFMRVSWASAMLAGMQVHGRPCKSPGTRMNPSDLG
jgi:hypothetical protein